MDKTHSARFMERVGVDVTDLICQKDSAIYGYDTTAYLKENSAAYYVAINSWLLLIRDLCGEAWVGVFDTIVNRGLISTVTRFASAADLVIKNEEIADNLVRETLLSVQVNPLLSRVTNGGYLLGRKAAKLQICRYLKRMSIRLRSDLDDAALRDFHQRQVSLLDKGGDKWWADEDMQGIRSVLATSLPWDSIIKELQDMRPWSRTFTSGASSDAGVSFKKKLQRLSEVNPGYFYPIMGSWLGQAPSQKEDPEYLLEPQVDADVSEYCNFRHKHAVKVSTAPKAMKGPRVIAMEPTDLQMAQRFAKDVLYRYFPKGMDLRDQTINQRLAYEGSREGNWATLDLSAASDYVTKRLVWELFPHDFLNAIWWMVPSHYIYDGAEHPLASFATMGNGLTFWVESVTFWAICSYITGVGRTVVYGDDIVVPTNLAATCTRMLNYLGFVVNDEKSFVSGSYRESCGVEYEGGIPMTSVYYPRFPIVGEVTGHTCSLSTYSRYNSFTEEYEDATSKLVALQHKLSAVSVSAARFVAALLRDAHPQMTTSLWGEDAPDIWGPDELTGPDQTAPFGKTKEWLAKEASAEGGAVPPAKPGEDGIPPEDAARRVTIYAPRMSGKALTNCPLYDHFRYARALQGPRPWRKGDGWLPENAYLPYEAALDDTGSVVVWGLRQK